MERMNPATGLPFKHGEARADGYRFYRYERKRIKKNGFFVEAWLNPQAFMKATTNNSKCEASKKATERIRLQNRAKINEYKLKKGCCLCGYNQHACALDFDHRDPDQKLFNISQRVTKNWDSLLLEIEKCDVLCANCHRVRTYNEKHYKKDEQLCTNF